VASVYDDDDVPQLRLSPVYRRLLARERRRPARSQHVKERFTAALQLMKSIEQRKHTILRFANFIQRQHEYLDYRGSDQCTPD